MSNSNHKMNVVQLTVLVIINMMGSGIVMLPTNLAQVGTMSVFSWIVTAGGSLALAYGFAQCGMLSHHTGGMGGYAEYSFGKSGSFMANYTYGVSLLIANVAIAISAVGYASVFFGMKPNSTSVGLLAIFVLCLTTVLNFGGSRITGRIGTFTVWGVILPLVFICIFGWFWFSKTLYLSSWNPNNMPFISGIGKSISITLWAFLGFESAAVNMDAVENPNRDVPVACLGGTIGAAVIYIVSTNVIAGIVPNNALMNSNAPFGLAFASIFNPVVGKIVMGLMVIACLGSLLGWQFTSAQLFKSSAVEGYFPKIFTKVTTIGTPIVGMIIITIIETCFALMTISPSLSKQFGVLVNLAVVTNLVPYLLSMSALGVMQVLGKVPAKKAKIANIVSVVAAVYCFYALYSAGSDAMLYGGLVTFAGWTLYGFVSHHSLSKEDALKDVS